MIFWLYLSFLLVVVAHKVVGQRAATLNCNFDQQNFCSWVNALDGNEDDFDWKIANRVPLDGWHSIPRTLTSAGFFAYTQGQFQPQTIVQGARAWLRSPVIDVLLNTASLSFIYWKAAAPVVLQICTRSSGETNPVCIDTISGLGQAAWIRRVVAIPPNPIPFQLIIAASGFRSPLDTLAIDDLEFVQAPSTSTQENEALPLLRQATRIRQISNSAFPPNISSGFPRGSDLSELPQPILTSGIEAYKARLLAQGGTLLGSNLLDSFRANSNISGDPTGRRHDGLIESKQTFIKTRAQKIAAHVYSTKSPFQSAAFSKQAPTISENGVQEFGQDRVVSRKFYPAYARESTPSLVLPSQSSNGDSTTAENERKSDFNEISKQAVNLGEFAHKDESVLKQGLPKPILVPEVIVTQERIPENEQLAESVSPEALGSCSKVACTFDFDLCEWYNDFKSDFIWKLKTPADRSSSGVGPQLNGSFGRPSFVFASADGRKSSQRALLTSGRFVIPENAFLEFVVLFSESSLGQLSLYRNDAQNPQNIAWRARGGKAFGPGWQRVRAPLPAAQVPLPVIIVAEFMSSGDYIAIDNIRLVDAGSREIACDDLSNGAPLPFPQTVVPLSRSQQVPATFPTFQPPWASTASFPTTTQGIFHPPFREVAQDILLPYPVLPFSQSGLLPLPPPWPPSLFPDIGSIPAIPAIPTISPDAVNLPAPNSQALAQDSPFGSKEQQEEFSSSLANEDALGVGHFNDLRNNVLFYPGPQGWPYKQRGPFTLQAITPSPRLTERSLQLRLLPDFTFPNYTSSPLTSDSVPFPSIDNNEAHRDPQNGSDKARLPYKPEPFYVPYHSTNQRDAFASARYVTQLWKPLRDNDIAPSDINSNAFLNQPEFEAGTAGLPTTTVAAPMPPFNFFGNINPFAAFSNIANLLFG